MEVMQVDVNTSPTETEKQSLISHFVHDNVDKLFRSLCVYVRRSNLAYGANIEAEASELLNEVVARALRSAERFDPNRQVMGWLLGIAANIILQERQRRALHRRREPFLQDLIHHDSTVSIEDFIATIHREPVANIEDLFASQEEYKRLMAFVSEEEQQLLHLSIIQQYTAVEIAEQLQSTAGAIRVRLFRALKRLRNALAKSEDHDISS